LPTNISRAGRLRFECDRYVNRAGIAPQV